jgi:exodeoxyribonuclease V alpha subunit
MPTIEGILDRITYSSEETGFVVARLQEKEKRELTTIVGNLAGITPGESLRLTGKWVQNKKFGEQFQVETFSMVVPATVNGIRKYLGSGLIRGIGPVMADRIVDAFGLGTLDVIEKTPKRLSEVGGIGPKRIEMITEAWEELREVKEIMIFLQGHGVSATYSAKIYKHYGNRSIPMVKENPYRLAEDIHGIGFLTADRIAQNMGMDPNSLIRAKAGLIYVLNGVTDEGHVYYPERDLVRRSKEVLKVDEELVTAAISELSEKRQIRIEGIGMDEPLNAVYLNPLFLAETGVARGLKELAESPSQIRPMDPEKAIAWVEEKLGIELAGRQSEAIGQAAKSKVLVITGGPGTGKTTIITAVVRIFQQMRLRVLLAAPTGRAAKRMSEATGWEARTIHRLLEYSPKNGAFRKSQDDPLEGDVIIIDEASMVDTPLMYHLLRAIPSHAHLILVGDVDQLPSVGPGNVLKDIIQSGAITVIELTEIFRQARKSLIIVNAHRINEGEFPVLKGEDSAETADFYFIEEEDPEKILDRILTFASERIPRKFGFHPIRDIQVLTPMHRGIIGSVNLNIELQKRLNPDAPAVAIGFRTFKTGDKVMQITNNYDREVFNGDIGWVSRISQEDREMVIDFEGRLLTYDYSDLDEVVLAYAVSVHKSQGSEYPAVVLPVSTQHYLLLQRNLIYTGITRARKLVVLVGTKKALSIAIRNDKPQQRFTHLRERLKSQ